MPRAVESVLAIEGVGLEGDRYAEGAGTFSATPGNGREVTLIEAEAIEGLPFDLEPAAARRNLVTRGVALNGLVGKRFTVGEVEIEGMRLCEPCAHLERITQPGVLRGLAERGGLRAEIRSGGTLRVADPVARRS
ncbi:MAG: hypothetical protein H0V29_14060 [Thermoleophilaceae bacterium]|nr:hypothetical protein [Thermoleophilaceae bacterium]